MNREQYLNALKNMLPSLSDEEREEALQYYADYFEEAGDDEKVISELGPVEEVAKNIIEKFAGVPATTKKVEEESSYEEFESFPADDVLCYDYENKDIRSLELKLGGSFAVFIKGKAWMVETRGLLKDEIECVVKHDGTLLINNVSNLKRFHFFGFFNHERKSRYVPRILVTVPENVELDRINMHAGAGNYIFKDTKIVAKELFSELGAGNLELEGIKAQKMKLKCGMGNVKFNGAVEEKLLLDCGMGAVTMQLDGKASDYSYDCKVGLGDFDFNGDIKRGVHTVMAENMKRQHISVNVGMGSVKIKF